jgi:hypothetical protein
MGLHRCTRESGQRGDGEQAGDEHPRYREGRVHRQQAGDLPPSPSQADDVARRLETEREHDETDAD